MIRIVTSSPGFAREGAVAQEIARLGWRLDRFSNPATFDADAAEVLAQADYLVAGLVPVTQATLDAAPRLRAVLKHGVGVDNIDLSACKARGLPVTNTPGANADAVAELALGLMFALARNIPFGHNTVTSGQWQRKSGQQLGGKTLGIIGLGNIGKRLCRLAQGIGMRVIASDPLPDTAFAARHGVEPYALPDLLPKVDYLSLHIFGGAENAALIDAAALAQMKPTACLLNLARGEVIDLPAVHQALLENRLGGVAIDAYTHEPPDTSHPIFAHPRAIFSPHSGADTAEAFQNMGMMVIEDIKSLIAGQRPARCVTPKDE